MQFLLLLIVASFVLGGTRLGRWLCDRPVALLPVCAVAALSFYSLRVVL